MTTDEFARVAVLTAMVVGMGGVAAATFHAGAKALHTARVLSVQDETPKRPNCNFLGHDGNLPAACVRTPSGPSRRLGRPMV